MRAEQRRKREAVRDWWNRQAPLSTRAEASALGNAYRAATALDAAADTAYAQSSTDVLAVDLRAAASRAWDALYWHLHRTGRLGDTKA